MADFSISLSDVQNAKTVEIKGLGDLTVRKLGSGEELDLSAKMRRTGKIIGELSSMDFTKFDTTNPAELKGMEKLAKRAEELSDELDRIKRLEFNTYKQSLSDDQGGKVVDVIMNTLTDKERSELFKRIFGDVSEVTTPNTEVNTEENKTDE